MVEVSEQPLLKNSGLTTDVDKGKVGGVLWMPQRPIITDDVRIHVLDSLEAASPWQFGVLVTVGRAMRGPHVRLRGDSGTAPDKLG